MPRNVAMKISKTRPHKILVHQQSQAMCAVSVTSGPGSQLHDVQAITPTSHISLMLPEASFLFIERSNVSFAG